MTALLLLSSRIAYLLGLVLLVEVDVLFIAPALVAADVEPVSFAAPVFMLAVELVTPVVSVLEAEELYRSELL